MINVVVEETSFGVKKFCYNIQCTNPSLEYVYTSITQGWKLLDNISFMNESDLDHYIKTKHGENDIIISNKSDVVIKQYKALSGRINQVYYVTNNINDTIYIGSHSSHNISSDYLGSSSELSRLIDGELKGATLKRNELVFFGTLNEAKSYEVALISYVKKKGYPSIYNSYKSSSGGNYGEECNKKIGEANRKNWEENYEYMMERTQNEEVIKRRSETMKRVIAENPHKFLSHIEAINSNPDKIASTANTHRGMKRTEETGNNISEAKKLANMNKGKDKVASMAGKGSKYVTDTKNRYISRRVDSDYKLKVGEVFGVKKPPQAQGRSSNGYKKTVVTNTDTGDQYGIYLDLFELKSNEKIGKWKLGSLKK